MVEPAKRVLLVEPNAALRAAIADILTAEHFEVEVCASLEQAVARAAGPASTLALVAWQCMEGLLAEEHRHNLQELMRELRLVVMVPRRWARMLEGTDLGVTGVVAKPFGADELVASVRGALSDERVACNS